MGGPSTSAESSTAQAQTALSQEQIGIAQQQNQQQQANYQRMLGLEQPAIDKYTALASGDRTAAVSAAMPTISTLSQGYEAAKQSVFNSLPPGAARDTALANLETQKYTGLSTSLAQQVQAAPDVLANIGSGFGAFSLQELGASLSGLQGAGSSLAGASTTQANIAQQQNQAKASTMGFLGSLAGAAGTAFSGTSLFGSDRRMKRDIVPLDSNLKKAGEIATYSFRYLDSEEPHIGVMAQQIIRHYPHAVRVDPSTGYMMVDYGAVASIALAALNELNGVVQRQQRQIEEMESNVGRLRRALGDAAHMGPNGY